MKKYILLSVSALLIAAPVASFAQQDSVTTTQTNQSMSRQEVKSDLKTWEANGYKPGEDRTDYPAPEQKVEKRIQKEESQTTTVTPNQ